MRCLLRFAHSSYVYRCPIASLIFITIAAGYTIGGRKPHCAMMVTLWTMLTALFSCA